MSTAYNNNNNNKFKLKNDGLLFLQISGNKDELLTALNSTKTELIGVDTEIRHTLLSTNVTLAAKVPFKFLLAFHIDCQKVPSIL